MPIYSALLEILEYLGKKSLQDFNMSSKEFSVIMVGITVAARTILKHWKTPTTPGLKNGPTP